MKRGKLITFEGIDGCGKSTQLGLLEKHLEGRGVRFLMTREPGGTELGRKIRAALLEGSDGSVEPLAELLLYEADRAQHVRQLILPALEAGTHVLSDRFYDATTVYQGTARGFDPELISRLNRLATGGLEPDMTVLFDLDVEIGLSRTRVRSGAAALGEQPDRLDREPVEFHRRVRLAYLDLARREPHRFRVIPSEGTVEETFRLLIAAIEPEIGPG
ncbi:MAG: dTMP kinase [Acidobacteriota bacterium]|nr:MAG: dTMP kinase [Acidobacteriota bacterium]